MQKLFVDFIFSWLVMKGCVFALDITFYERFYETNFTKWQRAEMEYLRLSLNNKFNGFGCRKLIIAVLKVIVLKARFIYVNCLTIDENASFSSQFSVMII